MSSNCCERECLHKLSYAEIMETRARFLSLGGRTEEKNYLLRYVQEHSNDDQRGCSSTSSSTMFLINGKHVCKEAWLRCHSVTSRKFEQIVRDYHNNDRKLYQHGNKGRTRYTEKTSVALAWLNFLVNAIGNNQPDSGQIYLPSCFTKLSIYRKMCKELNNDAHISKAHFYRLMDTQMKNVIIPKVSNLQLTYGYLWLKPMLKLH